jgi:transposase
MSLHAHSLDPIPNLTRRFARASFPKGTLAMHLRDALGPLYQDADFADRFPRRGRAAEAPWRLALVTVLQAVENLSDRQAAEMVRGRLDWIYTLSLPLDDPGFDASMRTDFRQCRRHRVSCSNRSYRSVASAGGSKPGVNNAPIRLG